MNSFTTPEFWKLKVGPGHVRNLLSHEPTAAGVTLPVAATRQTDCYAAANRSTCFRTLSG
jgi:hypothetical protein